jgi:hypothetical protein
MEQIVNYQAHLSTIWDLLPLSNVRSRRSDIPDYSSPHLRTLQEIPDYASPPTQYAISLTPKGYRPKFVIDAGINLASLGLCNEPDNFEACQIIFTPPKEFLDNDNSKVGVLFYGGALVDPRGYSPIAHQISNRYGLPVVIPFFKDNIAFDFTCNMKRVELASRAFPHVEKWVLAGHSMGGIGAMSDLFTIANKHGTETHEDEVTMDDIAGLVLIASYIRQNVGCGMVDFSEMDLPAATVYGDLDGVINQENWDEGLPLLPQNGTLILPIFGGNHGNFGSYDYSLRKALLGQNDGNATIPETLQHDMTVMAIMSVASRAGVPLPIQRQKSDESKSAKGKKSRKSSSKSTKGKKSKKSSSKSAKK